LIRLHQASLTVLPNSPPILGPMDLDLTSGECLAVVGPSGSGKSTLLNLMGGLQAPTAGTVEFEGQNLAQMDEQTLGQFRNQKIGFIFQSFHLHPARTVLQNLMIPLYFSEQSLSSGEPRAVELLQELGLKEFIRQPVARLSGGQRQRVAIARALMCRPKLILADEPAGNLDEENALLVLKLFQRLKSQEAMTFCLVTHHPTLLPLADRILELQSGRIQSLIQAPQHSSLEGALG
jgi:ABC-type lipoprotein export system ATPase subunit